MDTAPLCGCLSVSLTLCVSDQSRSRGVYVSDLTCSRSNGVPDPTCPLTAVPAATPGLVAIADFCAKWYVCESLYQEFRTRMVYLDYITCLRYTVLVRNPRYITFVPRMHEHSPVAAVPGHWGGVMEASTSLASL